MTLLSTVVAYAGVHDLIGGQAVGYYDDQGNQRSDISINRDRAYTGLSVAALDAVCCCSGKFVGSLASSMDHA